MICNVSDDEHLLDQVEVQFIDEEDEIFTLSHLEFSKCLLFRVA